MFLYFRVIFFFFLVYTKKILFNTEVAVLVRPTRITFLWTRKIVKYHYANENWKLNSRNVYENKHN